MAGSSFGNQFRITTWGESHGKGLGVVIDGCPAGLSLSEEDIQKYLDRRKPGVSQYVTKRKESDTAKIMSGVFEGRTTGTPISIMVLNEDQRSTDYSDIEMFYRPGHADYTFDSKYGFRDYRGGGRSSGRETVARVAAGAVACKLLQALGIEVCAYTQCIGGIGIDYDRFDILQRDMNPFAIPDKDAADSIELYARQAIADKDSLGGIIECVIKNMPAGVGEPVFDKLDANLSKAIMSIGAVKGFEIGEGFMVAELKGSKDVFLEIEIQGALKVRKQYPDAVLMFVTPPDAEELRRRLISRGTETMDVINARLERAIHEAEGVEAYDYIVINDVLEDCVETVDKIIKSEHNRTDERISLIQAIRRDLKEFQGK